jgi:mRNA-degrading endonuclease toxin of MazEF toxin-antitoxin module
VRPGVIVSGTAHNEALNTVVVVPTSSLAPEIWPLRMCLGPVAGKMSFAVIPGVRQVKKGRLRGTIGQLTGSVMDALEECLEAYLE